MKNKVLSEKKQHKIWERQDDARTLARAEEILADKPRTAGAKLEAQKMIEKEEKILAGLRKIASKTASKEKSIPKQVKKKKVSKTKAEAAQKKPSKKGKKK